MTTALKYRIDLPRWDQHKSVSINGAGRVKSVRRIWDPLQGNSRAYWRARAAATKEVIEVVSTLGKAQKIPPARHMSVTLTWAPGDNRKRDADNLWPLLKVCCDALARGPRKDLPGLRLVPDDSPEWMTKHAPVIAPPPARGLWLDVEISTPDQPGTPAEVELHGRINLALSLIGHRDACGECRLVLDLIRDALNGASIDQLAQKESK